VKLVALIAEVVSLIRTILALIKHAKDEAQKLKALKEINESFKNADTDKLNDLFSKLHDKK
jgi:hypothetical protein